jgi:hypothetical protein
MAMRGELASDTRQPRMKPYDLVREALLALGGVAVLVVVLAAVFSSPDEPPLTIRAYATSSPGSFLRTALGDLDGSGVIASYGPPYNDGNGSVQAVGPISPQRWAGVRIPVDTATDFILKPLNVVAQVEPAVATALTQFQRAAPAEQARWEAAYAKTLDAAARAGLPVPAPPAAAGPVGVLLPALLHVAQVGGLDGLLLSSHRFYVTDYTRPLLFISGAALGAQAQRLHLLGTQWGMMNETGNYPGAVWLWLYTFWYQIPPFSSAPNGDLLIMTVMGVLTLGFVLTPWIPGVNRLPRALRLYRLIWRDWYRR